MDIIPGPVIIEPATSRQGPQPQPVQALANLDPVMDDAAVRQAIANAEANNQDPQTLTMSDLAQGSIPNPAPQAPVVPQKFLKPDGAVDVDKIQASSRQLDEALQKKAEAVNKTVDDYMREYREKEAKFRNLPNPERLAASLPAAPATAPQVPVAEGLPQDFEAIVRRDYAADPLGTTTRLLDLMIQRKFAPMEEEKKFESVRGNIQKIAENDPRILREDIFAAVNAKLQSDPDLWKLKNPHKAAYLEVKEEMRLGDAPQGAPAQPSRPSPVLGGGTPPSAPSSTVISPQNVIGNLYTLDLRDKKQEAMGDEAIRAALAANRW